MPFDPSRLKTLRKKRRFSLKQLARRLNIAYQQLQAYERGTVKPGADRLEQLVNALETNMDYLMGRSTYDGEFTERHARLSEAFDRRDIDAIIALVGEEVGKQEPPEKRASGRSPRAKKKLSLRR
jgi:transcriptional regulator with XRE-family HTH domain